MRSSTGTAHWLICSLMIDVAIIGIALIAVFVSIEVIVMALDNYDGGDDDE